MSLPAAIPQNLVPNQPSVPPTLQDIGRASKLVHKLQNTSGKFHIALHSPLPDLIKKLLCFTESLGNITDTELGQWDEYKHTLVTTHGENQLETIFFITVCT